MNFAVEHGLQQQRMLLYKHDDDLNQEMLAIQFVKICDRILQASLLDLKINSMAASWLVTSALLLNGYQVLF